jgi:hypothetical protein
MSLPVLPKQGTAIALPDLAKLEQRVAEQLPHISDVEHLEEWLDEAVALAGYLRRRKLHRPMLGAQRRVEARLGQLWAEKLKGGRGRKRSNSNGLQRRDIMEFRVLAAALEGKVALAPAEWQTNRHWLVEHVRRQLPSRNGGHQDKLPEEILIGDFRDELPKLIPGSVDLIFTDPPYETGSIDLYGDLAEHAARVLSPGSSLVAYCGQHALPKILGLMSEHLRFWWVLASQHQHTHEQRSLAGKRVFVGWKPLVWFVKDHNAAPAFVHDWATEPKPDKSRHDWSQSLAEAEQWIRELSPVDGLVLDPFCGAGTTLVAARNLGRRALGVEKDEAVARRAAGRLAA